MACRTKGKRQGLEAGRAYQEIEGGKTDRGAQTYSNSRGDHS